MRVNTENAAMKPGIFTLLRKYRFAIGFAFTIAALYFANRPVGTEAFDISVSNTIEMLSLLPPGFHPCGAAGRLGPKGDDYPVYGGKLRLERNPHGSFPGVRSRRPSLCRVPGYGSPPEKESKVGIRIVFPWSLVHHQAPHRTL